MQKKKEQMYKQERTAMTPYMSRTELDMIALKTADIIRYYTLPDGTRGLLVIGEGKSINLCEYDDQWMMLNGTADRLYRVSPDACMDEYTAEILESRKDLGAMSRYGYLTGSQKYEYKVLNYLTAAFSESLMSCFLMRIYKDIGIDLQIKEIKGFRSRFALSCRVDGEEKLIPCRFYGCRNEFGYSFGNIFSASDTASITVKYVFAGIEVITESHTRRDLRHEYHYDLSDHTVTHRVLENGEIIFLDTKTENCPPAYMTDEEKLICGVSDELFIGCELPWGERVFLSSGEMICDNRSGLMVQICSQEILDNRYGEIYAIHEISSRKDRRLIQSELYCDGLVKSFDSMCSGFYYRYISGSDVFGITDDLSAMSAAQVTKKYLFDQK